MSEAFGIDDPELPDTVQAAAPAGSESFGVDDPEAKAPDADTYGGIEQIKAASEKKGAADSGVLKKNLVDPYLSQENQEIGKKAVRSLTSLPLGAIQLALDNTGLGKSDVAQSIARVQANSGQQSKDLDKNFPEHSLDYSHELAGALPQIGQSMALGPLFKGGQMAADALDSAGPWAAKAAKYLANAGIGSATSAALAGAEAQPSVVPEQRSENRGNQETNAALLGGAAPLVIPAMAGIGTRALDRLSPLLAAAKNLREVVGDKDLSPVGENGPVVPKFLQNIQANSPLAASVPGYTATTAQLAQNPGLATLERGARSPSSGNIANDLISNDQANKGAISNLVSTISPNSAEDIPALQETAQKAANKSQAGIANKVTRADNAATLADQLQKQTSDAATSALPAEDRAQLSSSMFDKMKALFGEDRKTKNQLFNAIDPDGFVPVASDQMKQSILNSTGNISDDDIRNELMQHPAIQKILGLPANISFKQLQEYRPLLSKYLAQARQTNDGLLQNVLGGAKSTLESYSDELANGKGGWLFKGETPDADAQQAAGQRAKNALDYYANTFSPRWNTGPGKALAQGIKTYNPTAPEVAGSKFLKPGDSAAAAYRNLNSMIEGDPSIAPVAQQHVLADMQQTKGMVNDNGIINPDVLKNWSNKNSELLKQVPSLKAKINDMYDSVKSAKDDSNEMAKNLVISQKTATRQQQLLDKSAIGQVLGKENVGDVVGAVMNSDNPTKNMGRIVKLANADKSGRAFNGLKQATYDHIQDLLTNTQTQVGEGAPMKISLANLDKYLDRPQKVSALKTVLGDDAVHKLIAARDGLRLMSTLSNFQALPGSQTSTNTAASNIAKRMLKGAFTIATGVPSDMIKDGVMQVGDALVGRTGGHLNKALLDPEYAKMLTTYNPDHPLANRLSKATNSAVIPAIIGTNQQGQDAQQ